MIDEADFALMRHTELRTSWLRTCLTHTCVQLVFSMDHGAAPRHYRGTSGRSACDSSALLLTSARWSAVPSLLSVVWDTESKVRGWE